VNPARPRPPGTWLAAVALCVIGAPHVPAAQQGEISGRVVTTTDPAVPLARVLVTIGGASLESSRTVITDPEGQFTFRDLPAGSFTVTARRSPFVPTTFGAKRPGRPGTTIDLASGQRLTDVRIRLAHGSAVTGMVRHENSEPAAGVTVEVMSLDAQALPLGPPIVTDDRGIYRAFGLPPGRYVVTARPDGGLVTALGQMSDEEMDQILAMLQRRVTGLAPPVSLRTFAAAPPRETPREREASHGFAPVHYPGTPDPERAIVIDLAEGEEYAGADIGLQLARLASVGGQVRNPLGALPSVTTITLTRLGVADAVKMLAAPATTRPDASGSFAFGGVLPGEYRVVARASPPQEGASWALADVRVTESGISNLGLDLRPGLRLSGQLAFDSLTQAPPSDLSAVQLQLVEVPAAVSAVQSGRGRGRADGSFEMTGILPGTYVVSSSFEAGGWWLRSVTVDGRDVLDVPLEIGPASDVTGAVVTFTDRHSELAGTLLAAAGVPASEYFVVVFPAERAYWRPGARRIRSARPSTEGRFAFRDLPAGDYLIAALTDVEPADLGDVFVLDQLTAAAVPVRLEDGETTVQNLRIAIRAPEPDSEPGVLPAAPGSFSRAPFF